MPRYRRAVVPGGTFFFTVVTYRRRPPGADHPLFADASARRMLGSVIRRCLLRGPFTMDTIVLLEDHLHAIWTLPPGDTAYSKRWGSLQTGIQPALALQAAEMRGSRRRRSNANVVAASGSRDSGSIRSKTTKIFLTISITCIIIQ